MSEAPGAGGLLSRVFGFGKPAKTAASPPSVMGGADASPSEQMLKDAMERKRRNDSVRKREFDMLREVRRKQLAGSHDPAARSSVFHSTLQTRPDDRASTINKINEIEAQMSMHWWKSNVGGLAGDSRKRGLGKGPVSGGPQTAGGATVSPAANTSNFPATQVVTTKGGGATRNPLPQPAAPVAAKAQSASSPLAPTVKAPVANAPPEPKDNGKNAVRDSDFSVSRQEAIVVEEFVHDPELEEAAIRFANGDDAGAEACLLEAVSEAGARRKHLETWLTLFDLYRAIGQREGFEKLALDFLSCFDRSAPQWFSMPEQVSQVSAPMPLTTGAPPINRAAAWNCPVTLTESSLSGLRTVLARVPQGAPWQIDWSRLAKVEPAAAEPLRVLLEDWANLPIQFLFLGGGQVDAWLEQATPSGDASVKPVWWMLRMAWLRLTLRDDDFESVALDYCVTYEVSPPSWESPRSEYRSLDEGDAAGQTIISEFDDASAPPALSTILSDQDGLPAPRQMAIELSGRITGDAAETLQKMEARFKDAQSMTISCAKLIRVDFPAAGSLLNWASGHHARGHQVQLVGAHRLLAVFFHVIGINEMARVVPRND